MQTDIAREAHGDKYPRFAYFLQLRHPQNAYTRNADTCQHAGMENEADADDLAREVGRRLKLAIKRAGLTQADLCRQHDWLLPQTLNSWIKGRRMLPLDKALQLAAVLGSDAAYLLTLKNEEDDPKERALLELYRGSDERAKGTIFRVAESESKAYLSDDVDKNHAA